VRGLFRRADLRRRDRDRDRKCKSGRKHRRVKISMVACDDAKLLRILSASAFGLVTKVMMMMLSLRVGSSL